MAGSDTVSTAAANVETRRISVRKDKTNPRRLAYLALLMFATEAPGSLVAIGAVLALAGILFHGWAAGYLARAGYAERESVLTVRGPYRHNRNPYYVAHLVMDFGFFCLAGLPAFYLLYFPVIFSVYRRWVMKEEPFLEEEFGDDYRQFREEVPRWRVRLTPASARGPEQTFDWATFRINREAHRALPHLALGAVLALFAFAGNPLAPVDPMVLFTVFAAFAVRLVIGDVRPLDTRGVSLAWSLAAGALPVAWALFLSAAPVWQPWPPTPSALLGGVGAASGLLVALSLLPDPQPVLGRRLARLMARAEYQWYAIGLGLGLLSGTLGGVWLGMLLPLILWAARIAGLLSSIRLRNGFVGSAVVLLSFAVYAAIAATQV